MKFINNINNSQSIFPMSVLMGLALAPVIAGTLTGVYQNKRHLLLTFDPAQKQHIWSSLAIRQKLERELGAEAKEAL